MLSGTDDSTKRTVHRHFCAFSDRGKSVHLTSRKQSEMLLVIIFVVLFKMQWKNHIGQLLSKTYWHIAAAAAKRCNLTGTILRKWLWVCVNWKGPFWLLECSYIDRAQQAACSYADLITYWHFVIMAHSGRRRSGGRGWVKGHTRDFHPENMIIASHLKPVIPVSA